MENKYMVSVLFVNYEDFWSKVVYYILGKGYGHAAISVYPGKNMKRYRR